MNITKFFYYKKPIFTFLLIDLTLLFFLFPISTNSFGHLIISAGFLITNLLVINTFFIPKIWIFLLRIFAVISFFFDALELPDNMIITKITSLLAYLSYSSFICLAIIAIGSHIFTQTRVNANVMSGGISIFLLLGFLWFSLYNFIFAIDPVAFEGLSSVLEIKRESDYQLFYYSFTTLTTLGYGDIVPVNKFAMTLATSEAMVGLIYPAIFISRLVGLYDTESKGDRS